MDSLLILTIALVDRRPSSRTSPSPSARTAATASAGAARPASRDGRPRARGVPGSAGSRWDAFAAAAPELAAGGPRACSRGARIDEGLLATVRGDALPRINPVYVGFVEGHLLTVALAGSAKLARPPRGRPLRAPRPPGPGARRDELLVRGRAVEVDGRAPRRAPPPRGRSRSRTRTSCSTSGSSRSLLGERPDADAGRRSTAPGAPTAPQPEAASSNTTTWRAACPARSRSKASSRSSSGSRRSISRSIGSRPARNASA